MNLGPEDYLDYADEYDEDDYTCIEDEIESECLYSYGAPDMVDEYCNFMCNLRQSCWEIYESQPRCTFPRAALHWGFCNAWHYGKCYAIHPCTWQDKLKFWILWLRLKIPHKWRLKEGHGKTDVSCKHGSRWVWWVNPIENKGEWRQVVYAPFCDCTEPPKPFKEGKPQ